VVGHEVRSAFLVSSRHLNGGCIRASGISEAPFSPIMIDGACVQLERRGHDRGVDDTQASMH